MMETAKETDMRGKIDRFGGVLTEGFHYVALFVIGGAIVWSAGFAFIGMAGKGLEKLVKIPVESLANAVNLDSIASG